MERMKVGLLGATGIVGQNYARLLENHPWFELAFVAASPASAGKKYSDAVAGRWHMGTPLPESLRGLVVHGVADIEACARECSFVFSALDSDVAGMFEEKYAAAGLPVVSNASKHRMDDDVPMLIPEINPEHAGIIPEQQRKRGWKQGFIAVKPNCSLQSYMAPLFALHRDFCVRNAIVTTMQAVSGAGHPGVSSFDMVDNVIPFIGGEEEKSEQEPLKILGSVKGGKIVPASGISISAHCNRVPVLDGHTACISVQFEKKPGRDEILRAWGSFRGLPQELELPSAPKKPVIYLEEPDRPQPRLDRDAGNGMAVSVGRLRECRVLDYRFVCLSHNTVRGAAGGGILNAELLVAKKFIAAGGRGG